MRTYKIDNKGTTSLFRNRFLEALTRTHFAVPVVLYLVIAFLLLLFAYRQHELYFLNVVWIFPLGLITFTLVEYAIHRWIFHFHADTEHQKEIKFKIHGVHHAFPKDKDRLVMPPVLSMLVAVVFYIIFRWMLGNTVLLFFPGFLSGYSTYLLIHYAVHRFRPPANFLKFLWSHHALHHYKSEDAAFGVSNPFWDYLFRTMPPKKDPAVGESREKISELL
ncbi:MAG: sterol desaturase family protein [Bacteroidia bacterium]